MTQGSTNIRDAADRLNAALGSLDRSLTPLVKRVKQLEKQADESTEFETDRARLASELDDAKAREKEYQSREKEFSALAHETSQELDMVIAQVLRALGED